MICVTWLLLVYTIYSGGVVCSMGLECEKCMLDGSVSLSLYISEV